MDQAHYAHCNLSWHPRIHLQKWHRTTASALCLFLLRSLSLAARDGG